jgi:hypothetical protein
MEPFMPEDLEEPFREKAKIPTKAETGWKRAMATPGLCRT